MSQNLRIFNSVKPLPDKITTTRIVLSKTIKISNTKIPILTTGSADNRFVYLVESRSYYPKISLLHNISKSNQSMYRFEDTAARLPETSAFFPADFRQK